MSTIASPREPPMRRMPSSSQTPTSSSRPSLETSRSLSSSPSRNPAGAAYGGAGGPVAGGTAQGGASRRNRAALREYYNLKKTAGAGGSTPVLEVTEAFDGNGSTDALHAGILSNSEVPPSEMDAPSFDPEAFVQKTLQGSGLEDLLRVYTRVLTETRALDAEKKSLVYDNYSRLITATETIRKMRATMDPLNPMASTLDPAIAHIYNQAKTLRDAMRAAVPAPDSEATQATTAVRARNQKLAATVLQTPERLRHLVQAGRSEEAEKAWERPRQLLEAWREQGVGGDDVDACLADGAAALRGEPSPAGWSAQPASEM
ncbi:uncharacterized protein SPSK_00560 [Sporothrix schenckii 1099-18]|uniref:Vacuolar protein sorting-associated protein 51 homolog n=2 Tax=Sporothrix schenckii TaxID=29908 RepID=U7Q4E8_SPOS1|nr:uncharacterized protein SPSK_00560 [Sporothrix schenckii 1099-18]ERT02733.1 hypothetical protein HMPREF1624_01034 [Sporothrix schenckii ATCC 58251]KJR79950.1 hypothetical protein SPSK_00560 [Sporothrix schenckii 1099-18]